MDRITCIAYILYQIANTAEAKKLSIQLLNGDISLRDLKQNIAIQPDIISAELILKKNKIDTGLVQEFAEKYLLIEA